MRRHNLGQFIYQGKAVLDTGISGEIKGESVRRLLRSPAKGKIIPLHEIWDLIKSAEVIVEVERVPLKAEISRALRGSIYPQT